MTREEQIEQYCAEQGFPYGACSGISSMKAIVATEAIKWADENPDGSMVKWQTNKGDEYNYQCLVTVRDKDGKTFVDSDFFCNRTGEWMMYNKYTGCKVIAWCKLSDIAPYKKEEK